MSAKVNTIDLVADREHLINILSPVATVNLFALPGQQSNVSFGNADGEWVIYW